MLEGDQCSSPTTPSAASLQPRTGKGLGCQTQACWTHQVSLCLSKGAGCWQVGAGCMAPCKRCCCHRQAEPKKWRIQTASALPGDLLWYSRYLGTPTPTDPQCSLPVV